MRVLVTGATGFIGRHTVADLISAGHEVISLSRAPDGPSGVVQHLRHDLALGPPTSDVEGIEAIVHLAGNGNAQASWSSIGEVAQINSQGTLHALQLAVQHGSQFVLASTQRIYQPRAEPLDEDTLANPPDPYGYTKLAAELYVAMAGKLYGVPGAILRFFSVYGTGQVIRSGQSGVVAILGQRAIEGKPLLVMSHQQKDFVDVSDAVRAIRLALGRTTTPARPYNIATGVATSVLDLARAVRCAAASDSQIVEDYSEGDPGALVANIDRARRELGFEPNISLEEGLRRYVEWLAAARPHSS